MTKAFSTLSRFYIQVYGNGLIRENGMENLLCSFCALATTTGYFTALSIKWNILEMRIVAKNLREYGDKFFTCCRETVIVGIVPINKKRR